MIIIIISIKGDNKAEIFGMLTLALIPVGQEVRIVNFHHPKAQFRHKLLAMGLTPGAMISVIRVAPLGDPVQVKLRGYTLSLRKKECQQIEVEYVHSNQPQFCTSHGATNYCACRQSKLRKNYAI